MSPQLRPARFLYTPTHRDCSSALGERVAEAQWANDKLPGSAAFCLIEHNLSNAQSIAHRSALEKAQSGTQTPILHLTGAARREFIDAVLDGAEFGIGQEKRLKLLLNPIGISYGAGPNIAYLLATALGSSTVHRRDSDVRVDTNRPKAYPIELEVAAIGRRIDEIPYPVVGEKAKDDQRNAKVVGTGTFGDATFDRRDLFAAGDDFIVAFQRLGRPGIPDSEVRSEAIAYLREEPQIRYGTDFYEVDVDGRVEMESCCICQIYLMMPEMPTDILGCDYMTKDIPWLAGDLILYHSRKMQHIYDRQRARQSDMDWSAKYALLDLMYIQMGRVWRAHNDRLLADLGRFFADGRIDNRLYAESFRNAAHSQGEAIAAVRTGAERVYRQAAQAAPQPASERLARVADEILRAGSDLDRHVVSAVEDFAFLVEKWPRLVRSAQTLDASQLAAKWTL